MKNEITEAIKESFEMLDLEDNWDSEGALAISPKVFYKAMIFVNLIASEIENLVAPSISPANNDTIDVYFINTKNGYLLTIAIGYDNASCYGAGDNGKENEILLDNFLMNDIYEWCRKFMVTN